MSLSWCGSKVKTSTLEYIKACRDYICRKTLTQLRLKDLLLIKHVKITRRDLMFRPRAYLNPIFQAERKIL